jgi:hypothetical protein
MKNPIPNRASRVVKTVCILSMLAFLSGCIGLPRLPFQQTASVGPSDLAPNQEVPALERTASSPVEEFELRINDMLAAKDFAGIEAEANAARSRKERFSGGYWKINKLYGATTNFYAEYKGQKVTDELWSNRIELLKLWKSEMPQSLTARVALGGAYMDYAWFARGTGFANTVPARSAALMEERLKTAEAELIEARKLGTCPVLLNNLLTLAKINGASKEEFDALFEEAVKSEPNYIGHYLEKADALKEKWHGTDTSWQDFVDSIPGKVATLQSDEANIIYFAVVASKLSDHTFANNWAMISKDRIKKGFEEMEKKFGPNKYRLNQFAFICMVSGNIGDGAKAIERIGTDRDDEVWSEQTFQLFKQIAKRGSFK